MKVFSIPLSNCNKTAFKEISKFLDPQKSGEWRKGLERRKSAKRVPPVGASAEQQKHEESARGMLSFSLYLNLV